MKKYLHCLIVHYTDFDVTALKARYIKNITPGIQYVKLSFELKEINPLCEVTKIGSSGNILKKASDLKEIFHYENKPCPRLIVIMGGPGEY